MKAFFSLLRQELVIMTRNGVPLVLGIVLVVSAGSIHGVRAVERASAASDGSAGPGFSSLQDAGQSAMAPAEVAPAPALFVAGEWTVTVIGRDIASTADNPPLADRLLLALLVFEVLILGFLFVAVGLFQELDEGSLRAYRLSPGGQVRWMAARYTLWVVASLAYAGAFLVGSSVWPGWQGLAGFVLITISGTLVMTAMGLTIAVFTGSMSAWFIPAVGLLMLNMAPMGLADKYPAAFWLTPGGAALAGYGSILRAGPPGMTGDAILWLCVAAAIILPLSWLAVRVRVFREGSR